VPFDVPESPLWDASRAFSTIGMQPEAAAATGDGEGSAATGSGARKSSQQSGA
jgi:hypothetical protein